MSIAYFADIAQGNYAVIAKSPTKPGRKNDMTRRVVSSVTQFQIPTTANASSTRLDRAYEIRPNRVTNGHNECHFHSDCLTGVLCLTRLV